MTSTGIEVKELWTAAGVLLGFEATAFYWRITNEANVAGKDDLVWLPPADYLNMAAMLVTALGVFVAPALGLATPPIVRFLFGLSALLYVGHLFTLAGHYDLYGRGRHRSMAWCSRQECVALAVVVLSVFLYCALSWCARSAL